MIQVLELEVWSRPGYLFPSSFTTDMEARFSNETGLGEDIFLPLSSILDQLDVDNLVTAFEEREFFQEEFLDFCRKYNFVENLEDSTSACNFLEFSYGRRIAWIHIPEDQDTLGRVNEIAVWVKLKKLVLVDPNTLCCLLCREGTS